MIRLPKSVLLVGLIFTVGLDALQRITRTNLVPVVLTAPGRVKWKTWSAISRANSGRLRDIVEGPDKALYLLTSS